jgi:uncharacterized protein YceH (UPF0502 family)
MRLTGEEVRVLGCLLEKQSTTPDAYPLTLNALRLACNQSTNRDPIVQYDDALIREALRGLERRGLTRLASGAGSRAPKHRHLLDEALPLSAAEKAVMWTLMLRGPQTPGELKQRGERVHAFSDLAALGHVVEGLIARDLVARLRRRPGQKEERFAHRLGEDEQDAAGPAARQIGHADEPAQARADGVSLEQRVARLERELAELKRRVASEPAQVAGTGARESEGREL